MSAWVVLKNGKVLKYNNCYHIVHSLKNYLLRDKENGRLLAVIPSENIERFEFERPSKIYREKRKDKLPTI